MSENHLVFSTWVNVVGSLGENSCNTRVEVEPRCGGGRKKRLVRFNEDKIAKTKNVENETTKK